MKRPSGMNIWIAAADNNIDKVKEFLKSPQYTPNSRDQNGYTPIHAAAEYAHLDLLKFLIKEGGDVNIKDSDGDTPLHACESVEAAKLLVGLGADLNIKNDEGLTCLEKAEEDSDFPELVSFLRKASGLDEASNETLPDNFKLTVKSGNAEEVPETQVSEEQRERLAEIIQNGTDADFEEYVKQALGPAQEDSSKKIKKD